ncbi:synaptojanin, putative [Bodo saltans]|uniref:Synaptojanin, putative n=1 Tax=Bodo saltans TaxID=75058 RepID=A0A0S4JHU2_BODSA|nr:synaptojanin, putative [Bodo saltans]|eukprot:CUG88608.1 synaptojanin, putative [Bodo saltans]
MASSGTQAVVEILSVWTTDANGKRRVSDVQLSLRDATSLSLGGTTSGGVTPIVWDKEHQKFAPVGSLSPIVFAGDVPPQGATSNTKPRERRVEGCLGVFGVVPLGHYDASLLIITEAKAVCTNSGEAVVLPGGHVVYEIQKMLHMPLPSKTYHAQDPSSLNASSSNLPLTGGSGSDGMKSHPTSPPLHFSDNSGDPASPNHEGGRSPSQIGAAALSEYRRLLTKFARCLHHGEGVHLYYSPTCPELCREPDVLRALMQCNPDKLPNGNSRGTPSLHVAYNSIEATFRWNGNLLDAFYSRSAHSTPNLPPAFQSVAGPQLTGVTKGSASSWIPRFVPSVFRGYVGGWKSNSVDAALITRLACSRAGTRYNRRGLDSITGMVANFSETTQLVYEPFKNTTSSSKERPAVVTSFRVIRGSIPRCWQQPANLTFKPTITVSAKDRGPRELRLHLIRIREMFGEHHFIHCIDATSLSTLEAPLSESYATAFIDGGDQKEAPPSPIMAPILTTNGTLPPLRAVYTKFDIGSVMKREKLYNLVQGKLLALVKRFDSDTDRAELSPAIFHVGDTITQRVQAQPGLFRINCLDCLDRANLVQSMLCMHVAEKQHAAVTAGGMPGDGQLRTLEALRSLWAGNGTALSALYAGSKPHFLDILVTGKCASTLHRSIDGGHIALQRYVQQNFFDGPKQDTISLITRAYHAKPVSANPFDRRMTTYKALIFVALCFAVGASIVNGALMIVFERYRLRRDFVLVQLMWSVAVWCLGWKIFKEPSLVASIAVLEAR